MRITRLAALVLMFIAGSVQAQGRGRVTLPYTVTDASGLQWTIYQQGWFRHGGSTQLFNQAGMLIINGNGVSANAAQARQDEKTGEIIFDGINAAGVSVVRRVLVNREDSYVRYVDVFKNNTQQDMTINVQLTSNYNYGVQGSMNVNDPKNNDRAIGVATLLQTNRAVFEMFGGKGARQSMLINAQPNGNIFQVQTPLTIPAEKEVALLHLHGASPSPDSAQQFILGVRESKLTSDLPLEVRRIIANVAEVQMVGDREILRGETFDVIELRDGDQLKGTLAEKSYKLQTFYGPVEVAAERVIGLINIGQFKPRQLLVTVDGEVFGGTLDIPAISLQLSSGQTTRIPLSQIERIGYRKRSQEPEEWPIDRPVVALRSGERLMIAMPESPIEVMTRFGQIKLPPQSIASLWFQAEDHGVHEVRLTDGSRFAGLLTADNYGFQLVGTTSQQKVTIPSAAIARLWFNNKDEQPALESPTLSLNSQDVLVGTLTGQLQLETRFDTISINAAELSALTHGPEAGMDVQAILWDQSSIGGQLREPTLTCQLVSGIEMKIPITLISSYNNPRPRPSEGVVQHIKFVVKELGAEDWKLRERAESQLVIMGPHIVPVLKEMRPSQSPEAQQRIDSVLSKLQKKLDDKR